MSRKLLHIICFKDGLAIWNRLESEGPRQETCRDISLWGSVMFRGDHEKQGKLAIKMIRDLCFISQIGFLSTLPVFLLCSPL